MAAGLSHGYHLILRTALPLLVLGLVLLPGSVVLLRLRGQHAAVGDGPYRQRVNTALCSMLRPALVWSTRNPKPEARNPRQG